MRSNWQIYSPKWVFHSTPRRSTWLDQLSWWNRKCVLTVPALVGRSLVLTHQLGECLAQWETLSQKTRLVAPEKQCIRVTPNFQRHRNTCVHVQKCAHRQDRQTDTQMTYRSGRMCEFVCLYLSLWVALCVMHAQDVTEARTSHQCLPLLLCTLIFETSL